MTKFFGKKVIKIFIFYPNRSFFNIFRLLLCLYYHFRPQQPSKKKIKEKRARTCTCEKFLVTLQRFFNSRIK